MSQKANIVVVGAGIVGVSVAYHLADQGEQDILLLDKGDLDHNPGSTSHAPGGLRSLTISDFFTRLGYASRQFYDKLPLAIEGQEQFFRTGLIQVANRKERFDSYKRIQEMGMLHGIESSLLTPQEVADFAPMIDPSTVYGGIFAPSSGTVKTSLIATSMRRLAVETGRVAAHGQTLVTKILTKDGAVCGVETDNPELPHIDCERVVLATNIWAPVLCEPLGVPMPLYPGEHQYIFTEPTAALDQFKHVENAIPIMTMDDIAVYFRQHDDRIGIGSYHHEARLVDPYDIICDDAKRPFTPRDFDEAWSLMQHHMPVLNDTTVSHGFNGMFAFTADHYPIVGESHVRGLWSAVGAWLSFASEIGRVLARWMIDGDPGMDMRSADIQRFHPHQSNTRFLQRQSKYYYEIGFDILHPNEVASSVRNLRLSPYHRQTTDLGGVMIPFASIETPWYYTSNDKLVDTYGDRYPHRSGYDATGWSPIIGAEHLALRDTVGLVDWSAGIGPIELSGAGALDYLNYVCSNKIDMPVGDVVYTLLLNHNAKIMRDVTVARLSAETFWLFTGKANMPAELFWLNKHVPTDGSVRLRDLGEMYVALGLWGPNARKVLQAVTQQDVSNDGLPYYAIRDIGVGLAPAKVVRISYAGELGYEIYAPVSFGSHVWDVLMAAGVEHGLVPVGLAAVLSLRLEKGYRLFGADIKPDVNPYEAGLGWMVKTSKPDFLGKAAALQLKRDKPAKKLVCLAFDDPNAIMFGYEPVLMGDKVVGKVTSADFGYSVGKFLALALIDNAVAQVGTTLDVRYTGNIYSGTVVKDPVFDPENERILAV